MKKILPNDIGRNVTTWLGMVAFLIFTFLLGLNRFKDLFKQLKFSLKVFDLKLPEFKTMISTKWCACVENVTSKNLQQVQIWH